MVMYPGGLWMYVYYLPLCYDIPVTQLYSLFEVNPMKILNKCPVRVGQQIRLKSYTHQSWKIKSLRFDGNITVPGWCVSLHDTDMVLGILRDDLCGLEVCNENTE